MKSSRTRRLAGFPLLCGLMLALIIGWAGCTGGSGGGNSSDKALNLFSSRNANLYKEVPLILVQGNNGLNFNVQAPLTAEDKDTDGDGLPDTPINDFNSLINGANRFLQSNGEVAACVMLPGNKQNGYLDPAAWDDNLAGYQPDTMPPTADAAGTNGTQFIQLILPFAINNNSLFDGTRADLDFLNPDFLTIEGLGGDGTGDPAHHVDCTVLVNGADVNGTADYPLTYPNWSDLNGININPGENKTSIVFIAQTAAGLVGGANITDNTPFGAWAGNEAIIIRLKQVRNSKGDIQDMESKWCIFEDGEVPSSISVESISAYSPVMVGNVPLLEDGNVVVQRSTSFLVEFTKPVVPESLGQSIVFGGSDFNGNTQPVISLLGYNPVCAAGGIWKDPISPNLVITTTLVTADNPGGTSVTGLIPFRCHPVHQNNLCSYVLNPIIDLPGSVGLGINDNKIRLSVIVYDHDSNLETGKPTETSLPVNLGITGLFGLDGELFAPGAADTETFTANTGGRYVNAPVSPHALYYAMGPNGLGVVDLDGNGFTTNDPDFSKIALVTSQAFYWRFGVAGTNGFNNYSYGYKATGGVPYIGLGNNTPIPGVNEGSTGMEEVVKDSNGNAMLYPDPDDSSISFSNISDLELGDFLDIIYYDKGNPWAHKSWHLSANFVTATEVWPNNLISTPPTPNPPPLALPIGMRPTHVVVDDYNILDEGAMVITGKEVFTVDTSGLFVFVAPKTGFVHLQHAADAGSATDEAYPPNRAPWGPGLGMPDYFNLGPVADSSTVGAGYYYGSRQQIGNFLFLADKTNNAVRVVNSNTMETLTTISNLNAPDSVAVSPDLKRLFVSNSGSQSVAVVNVDPRTDEFLTQEAAIWVGNKPKGLCCQPDYEDVFVCNFGSNSISIINPTTNSVRKTLSSLVNKPWDIVVGNRQFTGLGFSTGVFHGYISNSGANNMLVYESGPDGLGGIGYDDILDPIPATGESGQVFLPIENPRGLCWDPGLNSQGYRAGGCYLAHSSGGRAVISRIQFITQQAPIGPVFLIPNSGSIGGTPGFGKRIFSIVTQWGGADNPLSGLAAMDVAMQDYNRERWLNSNFTNEPYVTNLGDMDANALGGLPMNSKGPIRIVPAGTGFGAIPVVESDRLFISYQFNPVIDVIDPENSTILKTITGLPSSAIILKTYFKY